MVKKNMIHNIQPSGEHSPGRCVTVKVYNQERIARAKIRFTTRCKQGKIWLCQNKNIKKKARPLLEKHPFKKLKLRSTCTRMTGRKKYGEGLEQLIIQSIQHNLWNMVEQCDGMRMHGFQWHWVTGVYWWCDRVQKQPDEFWSVCKYTLCPDLAKCSKVD